MTTMPITAQADEPEISWREQKKHRTRRDLVAVSQRLFLAQGYSGTTLDDICDEAGVRPQTLLRYFESKAHLALAPLYDLFDAFRARLQDPDRTEDAVALWRANVEAESVRRADHVADYFGWVNAEPVLRAMADELNTRYEDLLAAEIATDDEAGPDDFHSVMLATMLIRGNAAVLRRWTASGGDARGLAANQVAVVDFVLEVFPGRPTVGGPRLA